MKEFIKVNRNFLDLNENKISIIKPIGTEGFLLYHYFLYEQGSKLTCTLTIKTIQEFLNRDYENRPILTYTKNKQNPVSLLKDKATIIKYIKILVNNGYIILKNDIPKSVNTPMIIECVKLEENKGFEAFPMQLFIDKIHRIGHTGFSILSLLGKNFNSNFGSSSCEGYANPSEEYIAKIVDKDIKTVRAYLYMLEKEKLIKIKPQDPICVGYNENNEPMWEFLTNNYEVKYKMIGNKYNIEE